MGSAHDDTLYYEQEARRRAEVTTMTTTDQAAVNTDRELWRGPDEGNGDFYADSIHVTEGGGIGMNVGGLVIVMPIREWHALAARKSPVSVPSKDDIAWTIFNTAADHGADFSWTVARAIAGKVLKLFPGG
jgi:hypothetical protein